MRNLLNAPNVTLERERSVTRPETGRYLIYSKIIEFLVASKMLGIGMGVGGEGRGGWKSRRKIQFGKCQRKLF